MVLLLKHDTYKYPVEEKNKKISNKTRPVPVRLEKIEDQDLEAGRELVEREADVSVRALSDLIDDDNRWEVVGYWAVTLNLTCDGL